MTWCTGSQTKSRPPRRSASTCWPRRRGGWAGSTNASTLANAHAASSSSSAIAVVPACAQCGSTNTTALGPVPRLARVGCSAGGGLDGFDLAVAEGTVLALVGPNGSGKTTTVRILSTLLAPDAGTLAVVWHDVVSEPKLVRSVIGVTGQFSAVDNLLTGRENLTLMADLNHLGRSLGRARVGA